MPVRARVGGASSSRALLLLVVLSSACSGMTPSGEEAAPQPSEVVPPSGSSATPTPVAIHGSRFYARAEQPSGGGSPTLETRHRAWLGEAELEDVNWVSTTEIKATVPAGLAPGEHGLTVENALGERGELEVAFTVLPAPSSSTTLGAGPPTASARLE